MSWDDCGTAGTSFRGFACNTNEGSHTLVVSFQPHQDLPDMWGMDVRIDLGSADPSAMPSWWQMFNAGSCRGTGVPTVDIDFGTACTNPWTGATAGVIGSYSISGSAASLLVSWALYEPVPVSASQEYYGINVRFDNRRTVGDGACAGCQTGMGFLCNVVVLAYGENAQAVHVIDIPRDRNYVCWQCSCGPSTGPGWFFGECPTPTLQATWGAIKSLYR